MRHPGNPDRRFARTRLPAGLRLPALAVVMVGVLMGSSLAPAQSGRTASPQEPRPRSLPSASQDERPIRLNADLVTVITSVTDPVGNQINNLTRDDFEIFEDSTQQEIAGFYRDDQVPLKLVFLFDTSTSIRHRFDFEQRAAASFFRQVIRRGDQAAVISVSNAPRLEAQFTGDVNELVGTLSRLKVEGATALYDALIEAASYVRPADGRRVMVVLSDGTDTASGHSLAQALREVQKADAVIYGVHSTGVAPSPNLQDLAGESVLRMMSEDTGGRAFFPPIQRDARKEQRELDEIYRRIAAELHAQYVLTYYSTSETTSAVFRSIKVQVRRPSLEVRARRGYYATPTGS